VSAAFTATRGGMELQDLFIASLLAGRFLKSTDFTFLHLCSFFYSATPPSNFVVPNFFCSILIVMTSDALLAIVLSCLLVNDK